MSLTKSQLKEIASTAWKHCYHQESIQDASYFMKIKGDQEKIYKILCDLEEEINSYNRNCSYFCSVQKVSGGFVFSIGMSEDMNIAYTDDNSDSEVVAEGIEIDSKQDEETTTTILEIAEKKH